MTAQTTYQYASGTTQVVPLPASHQPVATSPPLAGVNITVDSPTAGAQDETSIAVNTNNPSDLIGGSNDYRTGDSRCGRYLSTNNGGTWTDLTPFAMFTDPSYANNLATNIPFTAAGDPGVAFDADGHAYYLCMYFTRKKPSAGGDNTQYVHRSDDGGANWGSPIRVSTAAAGSNFDDKGHIAVDNKSSTANRGNIYVAWARLNTGEIRFARSTNGGASFEADYAVAGLGGSGANIAVGIDGTVYLASISGTTISIVSSTNGGQSFGAAKTVRTLTGATGNGTVRPLARTNSFPVIGTSPTNANTVYAVWSEKGAGKDDSDILFARSTDSGATWGSPVRVNDDINPSATDWNSQFFPWMAVDPTDGEINIVWYDNRLDPNHTDGTPLVDLYFASSTNDGLSFGVNTRVSTASSNTTANFGGTGSPTAGQFFGDYNGIAAFDGVAYPLWTDSRTGDQDVVTTQVGGADLAITKTASSNTVAAGTQFTYTIGVTNGGPASAFNVVVTDTLPTGLSYVSSTDTCTAVAATLTCHLGALASGRSTSFTVQVKVPANYLSSRGLNTATIINTATVTADQADPNPGNNTASASTKVVAVSDLSITKSGSPNPVAAGTNLTYTVNVSNAGPSDATNVVFTDNLPAGVTFLHSSPVACAGTTVLTCNTGTVASAGHRSFTIVVSIPADYLSSRNVNTAMISNTANVTSAATDPNPSNNRSSLGTKVISVADLDMTVTVAPNPVHQGQNVTYIVNFKNIGPSDALQGRVLQYYPAGFQFVNGTVFPCGSGVGTVLCQLGYIVPAGFGLTFKVTYHVPSNFLGANSSQTVNSEVRISSQAIDPDPIDATNEVTVTVIK